MFVIEELKDDLEEAIATADSAHKKIMKNVAEAYEKIIGIVDGERENEREAAYIRVSETDEAEPDVNAIDGVDTDGIDSAHKSYETAMNEAYESYKKAMNEAYEVYEEEMDAEYDACIAEIKAPSNEYARKLRST